jgi:hypothetical protein
MAKCKLPVKLKDLEGKEHAIDPFEPDVSIEDVEKYELAMKALGSPTMPPEQLAKLRADFLERTRAKNGPTEDDLAQYEKDLQRAGSGVAAPNAAILNLRTRFLRDVLAKVPGVPKEYQLRVGDVQVIFFTIWKACFQVPDGPLG